MVQRSSNKFPNLLFIDSGAHGIFNEFVRDVHGPKRYAYYGKKAFRKYMDHYAAFIKENEGSLDIYANVDAITNPEITWDAQMYLEEKHGLKPLPVVHHDTPLKWLERYLERGYDYIALGGVGQDATKSSYRGWADNAFKIICDTPDKTPVCKVHGFAMTSHELMLRWPWYSVDSTSWLKHASYGYVIYPMLRQGVWKYDEPFGIFRMSPRPKSDELTFEYSRTALTDAIFYQYVKELGFEIGKSEFKKVPKDHKLQKNELWAEKGVEVEIIVEPGLCNDSDQRCTLNALYFLEFAKHLPPWPWSWTSTDKQTKIFK